jgi:hypothetical protein
MSPLKHKGERKEVKAWMIISEEIGGPYPAQVSKSECKDISGCLLVFRAKKDAHAAARLTEVIVPVTITYYV